MNLPLALALLASPASADEQEKLFAQLGRCIAAAHAVVEEAPRYDPACGPAVQGLVAAGVPDSRLWQAYDALPAYANLRGSIVHYLLDRRVERALASLPQPNPTVVAQDEALDELLAQARAAHKTLAQAVADRLLSARGDLSEVSYQEEREAFEATIAAFVRGRLSLTAAESAVARFAWGHWCGSGADSLANPRSSVVLLKAIEDRRWEVAAGAIHESWFWHYLRFKLRSDDPRRKLLSLAGLDWELNEVGAALAGDSSALQSLGGFGSDRAARMLISGFEAASADPDATARIEPLQLLPALAAFVVPRKGCEFTPFFVGLYGVNRVSPVETSETTQQQILDLLARYVAPDRGLREAETASSLLVRLCRTESRDAFRGMLESPFASVQRMGFGGLRALGDDPVPQPEAKGLRFEITVDGNPFASRPIAWQVKGPRGASTSSFLTSDERGGISVSRDLFVDPAARVESIVVGSEFKEPTDAWFRLAMPQPPDLDAPIHVSVETQRLTVKFAESADELPVANIKVELFSAVRRLGVDDLALVTSRGLSRDAPIVFEHLQRDRLYHVRVIGPGNRGWTSDEVLLGSTPSVILVPPR
jgi:hypothetical protein